MATSAASAAAAMAARARREVIEYLSGRGAFDPEHAVEIDFPSQLHQRQLGHLIGRGVVHDTGSGRYWLDQAGLELDQQRRRDAAKLMLKIVLVAAAIAIAVAAIVASMR
jgi:hypothetical protein